MTKIKLKQKIEIKGKVTVRTYRAGTIDRALFALNAVKKYKLWKMFPEAKYWSDKYKSILTWGYIATPVQNANLVMSSPNYGIDLIVQRLVSINTFSCNISHGEIGTGTTAPALSNTALTTPTNRAPVAFSEDYGASDALLQFYFPDLVLANTTYHEFGTFVDGTDVIGTGQIFNHALFSSPYIKVAGQDTTVEVDFTLS